MSEYSVEGGTLVRDPRASAGARNIVKVLELGAVSADDTIDFSIAGCYTLTGSGEFALAVADLYPGQTGRIHILSAAAAPTLTFTGVNAWVTTAPTFTNSKLTIVTLYNDGTRIIGEFVVAA